MGNTIKIRFMSGIEKEFGVITDPVAHYVVESIKQLHGWFNYNFQESGKRECSQERMLLNPYNGCSVGCYFCYTKNMGSYFKAFWDDPLHPVAVFKDFDLVVAKQLSRLNVSSCAYISPTTDPFQTLEGTYHLSEKLIRVFLENGLPAEFITKKGSNVPDSVFEMIAAHPYRHSFCQFTCFTNKDDVLKRVTFDADTFDAQCKAIERARNFGVENVIARFDPIIPTVTDDLESLREMFERVAAAGATHVIMSSLDIPSKRKRDFYGFLGKLTDIKMIESLYENNGQMVGRDLNATMEYRRDLFSLGKNLATKNGLTFSLCMEFEVTTKNGATWHRGLNEDFMTSTACEKVEIPIYWRKSLKEQFKPLSLTSKCDGNCLNHAKGFGNCDGACNCTAFMEARSLELKDYRECGKCIADKSQKTLL